MLGLVRAGLLCLLATSAFGQRGFIGGGMGRGGFARGGLVGGGFARPIFPPGFIGGGFGRGFVRGGLPLRLGFGNVLFPGGGFVGFPSFRSRFFFGGLGLGFGAYAPFGYPLFAGYSYPVLGYPAAPNVTVVGAYPSEPAAPVIINQGYAPETARPEVREYPAAPSEPQYKQPIYLIAFKDHTIRAALAYWVEGTTLHYVTREQEHKQAPLDTVDRDFTLRLNRERRVPFELPVK